MKNKKAVFSRKNSLILLALVLFLAIVGIVYYKSAQRGNETVIKNTNLPGEEKIDLSPPTEEDRQQVDQHKEEVAKQQERENQPPQSGIRQVKPLISNAGYYGSQIEVRSFIPEVYEAGGACTVTLAKGSDKVIRESFSVKGATTTDCPPAFIPRSDLPNAAGIWTVTVTYSSSTSQGVSEPRTVEVQ